MTTDNDEVKKIMKRALALHEAGLLEEANMLYRQILTEDPKNVEALNYMGMLAHQVNDQDIAIGLLENAVALKPDYVLAHINLGNSLRSQGRLKEAVASYSRALTFQPRLGVAHYNIANALKDLGELEQAVASYRRAIALNPSDFSAHLNLGNTLLEMGKLEDAVECYRNASRISPSNVDACINLGNVLRDLGKLTEAADSYCKAISLKPDFPYAHYNLGIINYGQGRLNEAVECFHRALHLKPDFADAHNNLGNALKGLGRIEEAFKSYRQTLILNPDHIDAQYNLGNCLRELSKLEEAISCYQQVLLKNPDHMDSHINMGNAFKAQGRLDEASSRYRRALELYPDYSLVHSNLLLCMNYRSDATQEDIFEESLQWGDRYLDSLASVDRLFENNLEKDRKLRIGYVSPDFRLHSVAFFIEPVLRAHDREKVEVFCYANVRRPDTVTQRLKEETEHWHSIFGLRPQAVADLIRQDQIDILVDLAGHTNHNNLPVFARKPAPVQVTWLGYPNTTGLRTIDYRLTDSIVDPPGEADKLHTEKLFRLKHGFLCYQPIIADLEVAPAPCLGSGYVTFGSFNNLTKVTPEVIKVWSGILKAVPNSQLLLKSKQLMDSQTRERIMGIFAEQGIKNDRLEMLVKVESSEEHLGLYSKVDIGLDPFPYNGTTTTCEALWMGVPVVTLSGSRHASRVGASILNRIGMPELVANSPQKYIALAQKLARDTKRLQDYRSELRDRMKNSELMAAEPFTEHLEEVYQYMWHKYCASKTPKKKTFMNPFGSNRSA